MLNAPLTFGKPDRRAIVECMQLLMFVGFPCNLKVANIIRTNHFSDRFFMPVIYGRHCMTDYREKRNSLFGIHKEGVGSVAR